MEIALGLMGSDHVFREEDGAGAYKATQFTADVANALQEEICNVVEGAGISLKSSGEAFTDMTQLNQAITAKDAAVSAANTTDRNLIWSKIDNLETAGVQTPVSHSTAAGLLNAIKNVSGGRGSISGFELSVGSVPARTLSVADGACKDDSGSSVVIRKESGGSFSKNVFNAGFTGWSAWAEGGSGQGAIASGVTAPVDGKWLYVFALTDNTGTQFDYGIDDSHIAAKLTVDANVVAAGYTKWKRIGCIQVEGSSPFEIRQFVQQGNYFQFLAPSISSVISISNAGVLPTTLNDIPPRINCLGIIDAFATNPSVSFRARYWGNAEEVVRLAKALSSTGGTLTGSAGAYSNQKLDVTFREPTTPTLFMREDLNSAPTSVFITIKGIIDYR